MTEIRVKGIFDGKKIELLDQVQTEKPYLVTIHFERQLEENEYPGLEVLKYLGFWPEMPQDFVEEIRASRQTFFAGREKMP